MSSRQTAWEVKLMEKRKKGRSKPPQIKSSVKSGVVLIDRQLYQNLLCPLTSSKQARRGSRQCRMKGYYDDSGLT